MALTNITRTAPTFVLLVALGSLAVGCGQEAPGGGETNEIEIVVDGTTSDVWSIQELMKMRFDWVSPKDQIYPAVRVSDLLSRAGVDPTSEPLAEIRLIGGQDEIVLQGDKTALANRLLLKLDLNRGGTWQLVGEDAETEGLIPQIQPPNHVRRMVRIEASRSSPGS